jgi:hypothetical protein
LLCALWRHYKNWVCDFPRSCVVKAHKGLDLPCCFTVLLSGKILQRAEQSKEKLLLYLFGIGHLRQSWVSENALGSLGGMGRGISLQWVTD